MNTGLLERLAQYTRTEENSLRRDFGRYGPLIELELVPFGIAVKAVAGDDDKLFQASQTVTWLDFDETSVTLAVNQVSDSMRHAMGG